MNASEVILLWILHIGPSPAAGPSFYYGAYNLPFDTESECQHVADAYVGNKLHRYMQAWCVSMTPSQVQKAKEQVYFGDATDAIEDET